MRRRVVAFVVGVLALVLGAGAVGAWAASFSGPAIVRQGGEVVVHAHGLAFGRYGLFLTRTAFRAPSGGQSLECIGQVGPLRSIVGGSASLRGHLPGVLECRFGTGEVSRRVRVGPGRYHLLLAVPEAPGAFDPGKSFVRRAVRVVAPR